MKPLEAPEYEGWRLVGEEPFDDATAAGYRDQTERIRIKVRRLGIAFWVIPLALVGVFMGIVLLDVPRRGVDALSDAPAAIGLALGIAAFPDAVLAYLWFGKRADLKFHSRLQEAGGYWVYEPLSDEATEDWISEWDGETELDPDGKRREVKGIWNA